jgi:hypothetical protein
MLIQIDKETGSSTVCEEIDFANQNILECKDLAKGIEEHPSMFGEELFIITNQWIRFCNTKDNVNLLALDKAGNLVIIHVRFDESHTSDPFQTLSYAAYGSRITISDLVEMYVRYQKQKENIISPELAETTIRDFISNIEFRELNYQPRIILVAPTYPPKLFASILWLRRFGINITCIKCYVYHCPDKSIHLDFSILIPSVAVTELPRFTA